MFKLYAIYNLDNIIAYCRYTVELELKIKLIRFNLNQYYDVMGNWIMVGGGFYIYRVVTKIYMGFVEFKVSAIVEVINSGNRIAIDY